MPFDEYDELLDNILPKPKRGSSRLPDLISFAEENKLKVGSTTGGRHNRGSKHYSGNAIDIAGSGGFDDATVQELSRKASERGFLLRDERRRPPGQAVWGGPHLHVEAAGQAPKPKPRDAYDTLLDEVMAPTSTPSAPKPQKDIVSALQDLARSTDRAIKRIPRPPRQLSYGEMKREEYERDLSWGELKQAEDRIFSEYRRGSKGLIPAGVDPRVLKGEQPADRLAHMRAGDIQSRLAPKPTEVFETKLPSVSARPRGIIDRAKEAVAPYVPGLASVDTPGGIKTDVARAAVNALTLGAVDPTREISREEELLIPGARGQKAAAELVGSMVGGLPPFLGAGRAIAAIPAMQGATRAMAAARVGATFGSVETARQAIRAGKTGEFNPEEILVSTAIGVAMGAIPGAKDPTVKARLIAAVLPQGLADYARGVPLQEAALNAVTNLAFEGSGIARQRGERAKQVETKPDVTAQPETNKPAQTAERIRATLTEKSLEQLLPVAAEGVSPRATRASVGSDPYLVPKAVEVVSSRLEQAIADTAARRERLARFEQELHQWQRAGGQSRHGKRRIQDLEKQIADERRPLLEAEEVARQRVEQERQSAIEATRYSPTPRFDVWAENQSGLRLSQLSEPELVDLQQRYKKKFADAPAPPRLREMPPLVEERQQPEKIKESASHPARIPVTPAESEAAQPAQAKTTAPSLVSGETRPSGQLAEPQVAQREVEPVKPVEEETMGGISRVRIDSWMGRQGRESVNPLKIQRQFKVSPEDAVRIADYIKGSRAFTRVLLREELGRVQEEDPKAFKRIATGIEEVPKPDPETRQKARQNILDRMDEIDAKDAGQRDTSKALDSAKDFSNNQHYTSRALTGSPLREKVLAELPKGSVLSGPNAESPEMQHGAIRLRAPNGEIWEVDLAYDHRKDSSWKTIGTWMDGFSIRKTGEKAPLAPKLESTRAQEVTAPEDLQLNKISERQQRKEDINAPQTVKGAVTPTETVAKGTAGAAPNKPITTPAKPSRPARSEKPDIRTGLTRSQSEFVAKELEEKEGIGKIGITSEPSIVKSARARQSKRVAEKAEGIEYRHAGADPYELIDNIIVRGWDLYSGTIKPTFEEWSKKIREEFGPESDKHLRKVWVDLGGGVIKEPPTTSARKAQFAEDRAELDLPELPPAERKSWQETLDRAKVRGTGRASLLADEVLSRPRALNEVETAQIVLRAQEIKNEHSKAMREVGDAKDSQVIEAKRAEVEALEREFDKLTQAAKASGTEKGRALAAQKLTINQDYDLVSLIQRAKVAKGREITSEERVRYEQQATRIADLETQLAQAQEKAKSRSIQREIDKTFRQRKRSETKEYLDEEFAALRSQFALARAEAKGIQASGLAGLDPEGKLTPLIAKMARNRVKSGVVKADAVVDEVYTAIKDIVEGITPRDVRDAISGYGIERKGKPRNETSRQLAAIRSELKKLSAAEDVEAGKRLSQRDKTRQTVLQKQEAELSRKLEAQEFEKPLPRQRPFYTRETARLQNRVDELKAKYDRELRRAQRGKAGYAFDVGVNIANIPKTLKSMGDVSALLRQGGYFSITHPVLSAKAARDMIRSFTEVGFKNVEHEIKTNPDFYLAKRSGVEFTGVDKESIPLSEREEAFISNLVSKLPIAKQSEQTFVGFLDSQRMRVFERFAVELRGRGLTPEKNPNEFRAIAKLINIGTGRGSLGRRGNQIAPALNVLMFSPRLLASRVQLMNKMVNPVAIARMPPAARSRMIKDNVKFAGTIATALGLAVAAGASVSRDPDDADFLKVRVGNSRYDILTGLQQPMRFIYRMARAVQADVTGDETYAGEEKGELIGRFARTKAAPTAGAVTDYITGEDFQGRKFKLSRTLVDLVVPLYFNDFREAMKEDGIVGAAIKTAPSLVGIGVQTYKDSPEKANTKAEKLARKLVRQKMPDIAREEEKIEQDQKKAELRVRSRRGEDVTAELEKLPITERQKENILKAKGVTRLQEDFTRLGLKEALTVYGTMTRGERQQVRDILAKKALTVENLPESEQDAMFERLKAIGLTPPPRRPKRAERPSRPSRNKAEGFQWATP